MMFYPAEGEKPPFHADPEEGQVAPELPEGLSNEPEEDDEAEEEAPAEESGAGDESPNGEAPEADPNGGAADSSSPDAPSA